MNDCDCDTCCAQCGHDPNCTSQQGGEPDDGYSDYLAARAA